MKKILAFIIAALMIVSSFVSCGNDEPGPVGPGTNAPSVDGTNTPAEDTSAPEETEKEESDPYDEYVPEVDALFNGKLGFGSVNGSNVSFDDIKVQGKGKGRPRLIECTFDKEDSIRDITYVNTLGNTATDKWEIGTDPAKEDKKSMNYTGGTAGDAAIFGGKDWNYLQYSAKVFIPEEGGEAALYFEYIDEKNYSMVVIGEQDCTWATCYKVENGEKSVIGFSVMVSVAKGDWTSLSVTLEKETVEVFIKGVNYFSLYDPNFTNQYHEVVGGVLPGSVTNAGFGAPGEGEVYLEITADNIIHDGKGAWSNLVEYLPTAICDGDLATYYACDEYLEYANTDQENTIGIPGDGTFATGYVGGYFEQGVRICHIRYVPREDRLERLDGAVFEASVDGVEWVEIFVSPETPPAKIYTCGTTTDPDTVYHYVRYVGLPGSYTNAAELEFWGFYAE